jgi:hypothetical protein
MSANDIVDSGIELPKMASVQPLDDFVLKVKWAEGPRKGREDLVDVSSAVFGYKIYRPLRDQDRFARAEIAEDGDAVSWGDDDLTMSADTIQSLAQESWTPTEFAAFLERNSLTQLSAAALLGRSRRQIANYVAKGPIPRVVALACYGFESLRRDKFVEGKEGINAQPSNVRSASAATRSETSPTDNAPMIRHRALS